MSSKKFRSNIVAVIIDQKKNKILMFRRAAKRDANSKPLTDGGQLRWNWQFPQGGVDPGETEEEALFRELEEEIGTNDVTIIRVAAKRVRYNY